VIYFAWLNNLSLSTDPHGALRYLRTRGHIYFHLFSFCLPDQYFFIPIADRGKICVFVVPMREEICVPIVEKFVFFCSDRRKFCVFLVLIGKKFVFFCPDREKNLCFFCPDREKIVFFGRDRLFYTILVKFEI
jgi:hypothetical protein